MAKLPLPMVPRGGAVGTVVKLSATGLPPNTQLLIAFANLQMYQLLQRVTTDENGTFATQEVVPKWAKLDGVHYWFASLRDEIPLALSAGFHVTSADGTARISGTLVEPTGGCVTLHDGAETSYHLSGDLAGHQVGARVAVTGTIVEEAACSATAIGIGVTSVQALP